MISGLGSGFGFLPLSLLQGFSGPTARPAQLSDVAVSELQTTYRSTARLRRSLEELAQTLSARSTSRSALPAAVSSRPLGLNLNASPSVNALVTPEINATATSFSPFAPAFQGSSTAQPTITGIYRGSTSETLTIVARDNGTIGGNQRIDFDILDGAGSKLQTLRIPENTAAGSKFVLDNGLVMSFSAGDVVRNDSFQVAVSADVGSVVDPTKPFNGSGDQIPNFEYGYAVTAGSFDVNGVTIDVLASDSINSVLDRINASAAGISAVFDAASESIRVTRIEGGPLSFTFDNDSSGFLSATKLGSASDQIFTTLISDEVNQTPTSFGPFAPSFAGSSDAAATIAGIYQGSSDDTLSFVVSNGGTVGANSKSIKLDVLDGAGDKIDQIVISPNSPADSVYLLDNGLTVSFAAGELVDGDRFEVAVSATVGSRVDPTKPFNGTGNDSPNFDAGYSVTAGSFTINDIGIDVLADDTINSVIDRINNSGAGVTAEFYSHAEILRLRQNTPGAVDIRLGADTSGFLDAVRLTGKPPQLGGYVPSDADAAMVSVSQFAGIDAGVFSINGVDIAVDPDSDTIVDVIDRINFSGAGVVASLRERGNLLEFTAADGETPLVLANGNSAFFSVLGISPGTYAPTLESAAAPRRAHTAADLLTDAAKDLNALYRRGGRSAEVLGLRNDLRDIIAGAFDSNGPVYRSGFGVSFDFRAASRNPLQFFADERASFVSAHRRRGDEIRDFFLGTKSSDEPGLLDKIIARLKKTEGDIERRLGRVGLFVSALV